ncbi:3'(2'),5'-bisphosphate nucleotidase [Cryptococcus depauperatus CBS 7841]|uniref:3'(2'),5'-bisphosphate nucleotidase n=1 Tax=Cryptococcus depauperatus CBS 7841 TaxID=1295531 RepID=A0A1E3IJR1_9TREE|nr:3'(2'),5'-bisphosphate nucleotidase [Cryptococcus depauperatus CBS 7841]
MAATSLLPFTRLVKEAQVGILSVLRACHLTKNVLESFVTKDTILKSDKSPVTVADLSAQSLISLHLLAHFKEDPIIGEEDTSELRNNEILRQRVVKLVNEGLLRENGWGKNETFSEEEILAAIDAGSASGGSRGRFWTIAVDGTSGFIRRQQYAVCLALIVNGQVELGVIGCPNLGPEPAKIGEEIIPNGKGVLMVAVRGEGSWSRPLDSPTYTKLNLPPSPPPANPLTFLESVESGHSAHSIQSRIGSLLGIERPPLRIDSQAKYTCLSRGEGGVYLRIPTKYVGGKVYEEKIWDHASGALLIHESGGMCTDMWGKPLNFGVGRTLKENDGIVAAGKDIHVKAVEAVKRVIDEAQAERK